MPIRYLIDAFTTEDVSKLKDKIREKLGVKLDDDVRIDYKGNKRKIGITFRTPENERVLTPQELDEILSPMRILAFRLIISRVETREIATLEAEHKKEVAIVAAILAGLVGYALRRTENGTTIEHIIEVIGFYEKRRGKWVRI
jgi:Trk K+ transport system NAD-binding subunit